MIYTAVLMLDGAVGNLPMPNDTAARERVEKTENAQLRHHRSMAYVLLESAYFDIYGSPMPPLAFGEDGKPRLVGSRVKISVSHTSGICAVSFADADVGVDVQSYCEAAGKERVLQKFVNENLQKAIKSAKSPELQLCFYEVDLNGSVVRADCEPPARLELLRTPRADTGGAPCAALWSALEALLKCRHGFSELPHAEKLARVAEIVTFYLSEAALSVAIIK